MLRETELEAGHGGAREKKSFARSPLTRDRSHDRGVISLAW
jgi:hypothetical protein